MAIISVSPRNALAAEDLWARSLAEPQRLGHCTHAQSSGNLTNRPFDIEYLSVHFETHRGHHLAVGNLRIFGEGLDNSGKPRTNIPLFLPVSTCFFVEAFDMFHTAFGLQSVPRCAVQQRMPCARQQVLAGTHITRLE